MQSIRINLRHTLQMIQQMKRQLTHGKILPSQKTHHQHQIHRRIKLLKRQPIRLLHLTLLLLLTLVVVVVVVVVVHVVLIARLLNNMNHRLIRFRKEKQKTQKQLSTNPFVLYHTKLHQLRMLTKKKMLTLCLLVM